MEINRKGDNEVRGKRRETDEERQIKKMREGDKGRNNCD